MFRVVTVAREYGSGGGRIAQSLADQLGWKLLDRCLVEKIAQTARVKPEVAEKVDERLDPWFYRLQRCSGGLRVSGVTSGTPCPRLMPKWRPI